MRLINVPLESIEERYSADWNRWFPLELDRLGISFLNVVPDDLVTGNVIEEGEFLDITGTNLFKMAQISLLLRHLKARSLAENDVILLHDGWFPGVEAVKYSADLLGIKVKFTAYLHAGTYHDYDFLTQKGLGSWAEDLEKGWFKLFDKLFVSTHFHRDLLITRRGVRPDKIEVVGMPYLIPEGRFLDLPIKKNFILFPHRLYLDKNLEAWESLGSLFNGEWSLKTSYPESKNDKAHYYRLLSEAKIVVSTSHMETFGISMMEAVFAGAVPLVPAHSAFLETYPNLFQYTGGVAGLILKIRDCIENYEIYQQSLCTLKEQLKGQGEQAIEKMVRVAQSL